MIKGKGVVDRRIYFNYKEYFKYFIDMCHKNGISVIMDWVPAHFPKDGYALARFDGTPLFEHPDSRLGEHKEWGTYVFNWGKSEIHSFLISNAVFFVRLSLLSFGVLRLASFSHLKRLCLGVSGQKI